MRVSLFIILLLFTFVSHAQKSINKTFAASSTEQIDFDFKYANVKVSTWNKNEISITGTVNVNMGEENDAFAVKAKERGNRWFIKTYLEDERDIPKLIMMSKDGVKTYKKMEKENGDWKGWDNITKNGESYDYVSMGVFTEINLEIKVPKNVEVKIESRFGNVDIENFENDLEVENTHGHVNAVFSKPIKNAVFLKSTHDFVDVSIPSNSPIDIQLKSSHGEILTDLDLNFNERKSKNSCSNKTKVSAILNGGGTDMVLISTHDNIYLREYKMTN